MTLTSLPDGPLTETAKRIVPEGAKTVAKSVLRAYGRLSSPLRSLPDYLIIGAKRCGTTSLHNYLLGHPEVATMFPATEHIKGVHYFDRRPDRSRWWYRSFFPLRRPTGGRPVCGEASPYYLIHPLAAERAAATVPHAKIIALLREPAERAFSHYRDEVKLGHETLSFADAIAAEPGRMRPELDRIAADPTYYSRWHEHLSYVTWGRYVEHLARWRCFFPAEQMLVLRSEDLFERPGDTVRRVTDFLGLHPHAAPHYPQYNATSRTLSDRRVVEELRSYYRPYNERLNGLLPNAPLWGERGDSR